ncbi:hypothetical protein RJ641_025177 [Dillenia turbinata]|uniref:Uncharacterized protein n=1 Tax=Dillenia turbinata TaxID=194707 RepID=A0AAN8W154_9MAGN
MLLNRIFTTVLVFLLLLLPHLGAAICSVVVSSMASSTSGNIYSSICSELNADWQRAVSGLPVSIGSRLPDLFTPRIKGVLSCILPIPGNARDVDNNFCRCPVGNILNASPLSKSGPPMLDYKDLSVVLSTLLPVVSINNGRKTILIFLSFVMGHLFFQEYNFVLQDEKVNDKAYVRDKIDWIYKQTDLQTDLVWPKPWDWFLVPIDQRYCVSRTTILEVHGLWHLSEDFDDIHAALALIKVERYLKCYAYFCGCSFQDTNMLSRLLHVHQSTAKQAVFTAIDLLV